MERNHHVLEIGSGWGSLAMEVVKQTGCKYTGITLSEEQLKYAQMKVKEAGLEVNYEFILPSELRHKSHFFSTLTVLKIKMSLENLFQFNKCSSLLSIYNNIDMLCFVRIA